MKRIASLSILFAGLIDFAIERARFDLWITRVAIATLLWNDHNVSRMWRTLGPGRKPHRYADVRIVGELSVRHRDEACCAPWAAFRDPAETLATAAGVLRQALAIGAVLMAMIFAEGHISRGHYNPVVTLGIWMSGRIEGKDVIPAPK
jgi:hypothetical protein